MEYLLVNFGGPRNLEEVPSFLEELLCDRDVVRARLPGWLHSWFFRRIARKRAFKVSCDYEKIGGRSPIFFDTEKMREALSKSLGAPVFTFHRYLPSTHKASLAAIELSLAKEICVIPLFPQFCFATTGSIARFLTKGLSSQVCHKLRWIRSYADHPAFIQVWQKKISAFLEEKGLCEAETMLLFSAHGVPKKFIEEGDVYEQECQTSFAKVMEGFPSAFGTLCYQSKFGRGVWLTPSTEEVCAKIASWSSGRESIVVIPITFTSDHIETLFEIEELYLPLLRQYSSKTYRCPALNLDVEWIKALTAIAKQGSLVSTGSLIRG